MTIAALVGFGGGAAGLDGVGCNRLSGEGGDSDGGDRLAGEGGNGLADGGGKLGRPRRIRTLPGAISAARVLMVRLNGAPPRAIFVALLLVWVLTRLARGNGGNGSNGNWLVGM